MPHRWEYNTLILRELRVRLYNDGMWVTSSCEYKTRPIDLSLPVNISRFAVSDVPLTDISKTPQLLMTRVLLYPGRFDLEISCGQTGRWVDLADAQTIYRTNDRSRESEAKRPAGHVIKDDVTRYLSFTGDGYRHSSGRSFIFLNGDTIL
ncbi:hypothetical protein J6590_081992 [Homalodisca vitripennis]|nr:hypothetical protein J6590_081992 [Homalodisca vitripennis]